MRVKEYEVSHKDNYGCTHTYWVDAPSKRIAKWCGATLYNHLYVAFLSAKDMKAKRFKVKGG
jgi:hypothetical protein